MKSVLVTLVICSTCCVELSAKDYFLTIGGGYSPTGNQISLEKNVQFFQRVLTEHYPTEIDHTLFFSDGSDPGRDLQHYDPNHPVPDVYQFLGKLFDATKGQNYQYRTHSLARVNGPSSKLQLNQWFAETGAKLTQQDRLFIYATAHGGKSSDKKRPGNTKLYLWNRESVTVQEFESMLDQLAESVPVTLVMVQCYSGGFANLIFDEGNPEKGLSKRPRAGYFATVESRPAAGCTADIHEANYQEYSSSFWAAISGTSRIGEALEGQDFNNDGRISFAEAHTYTILNSTTIDIPVCTTDAFVRTYGKIKNPLPEQQLYTTKSSWEELSNIASPLQSLLVERLSIQLELTDPIRYEAVEALLKKREAEKKKIDQEASRKKRTWTDIRKAIHKKFVLKWPEFNHSWHPDIPQLIETQAGEMKDFIEQQDRFEEWEQLYAKREVLSRQSLDKDREIAYCKRLLYVLETIALRGNVQAYTEPTIFNRYLLLELMEDCSLGQQYSDLLPPNTITALKSPISQSNSSPEDFLDSLNRAIQDVLNLLPNTTEEQNTTGERPVEVDHSEPSPAPLP